MKRAIFMLIGFLVFSTITFGQYWREKAEYNTDGYRYQITDQFSPELAAYKSLFLTGNGQHYLGKKARGIAFKVGSATCWAVILYGWFVYIVGVDLNGDGEYYDGDGVMIAGATGVILMKAWSVLDAIKVAKVYNMVWRDKRGETQMSIKIKPYLGTNPSNNLTNVGLSVKLTF